MDFLLSQKIKVSCRRTPNALFLDILFLFSFTPKKQIKKKKFDKRQEEKSTGHCEGLKETELIFFLILCCLIKKVYTIAYFSLFASWTFQLALVLIDHLNADTVRAHGREEKERKNFISTPVWPVRIFMCWCLQTRTVSQNKSRMKVCLIVALIISSDILKALRRRQSKQMFGGVQIAILAKTRKAHARHTHATRSRFDRTFATLERLVVCQSN